MPKGERALERGLLEAARAGDEAAWRALYEMTFDRLYSYALWRSAGLRDVADDITQETWLTAVRRLGDFDPDKGSLLTWLRGIAANNARNRFRKNKRLRPLGATDLPAPNQEENRRDEAEAIAQALAELPSHYEAALRAKYLDGQSVAEMAEERGESVKAVESLLARARQALREAFANKTTRVVQ